jgi:hypothetical protein
LRALSESVAESILSVFAWFSRSTSWFWSLGAWRIENSRRLSAFDRSTSSVELLT